MRVHTLAPIATSSTGSTVSRLMVHEPCTPDEIPRCSVDGDVFLGIGNPPLVSVIMAACNAAAYVGETCRSVLGQTYSNLELIVVDDGSVDRTAEIVAAVAASDRRVRLVRQNNLGVAAARNVAIAHAAGDFIAPIDADDLWLPAKIERQMGVMQQQSSAGFVYCWWAWIDERNRLLDRAPRWGIEGHVWSQLLQVNFAGNASVPLFRRAALAEAGGYDAGLHAACAWGCEDWGLALRVARRYPVAVVPAVLVGYRRRSDGMSSQCDRMWRSYQLMWQSIATGPSTVPAEISRRSAGQFALYLAGVAFWDGDYLAACRWALRARSLSLMTMVLPHALRAIARRVAGDLRRPPVMFAVHEGADEAALPEPLVPYDRIYARYWSHSRRVEDQTAEAG